MAKKKMKQCPECGKEIGQSAKRCPFCDAKQKKKLKIWQIVVAIIIIFVLIGSCGGGEDEDKPTVSKTQEKESASENDTKTKSDATEEIPEIEEQVIYEGNDVVITAKGIEKSGSGWNVKLLIENNSALNLGFNAHAYGINGIMTHNNIYDMDCDVAAGKKANTELEIKGSVLNDYGITEVRCIDVLFWAYDNDEMFKEFDTDQIEIQTSLYDGTHDVFTGDTIYESDGIKVDYLSTNDNDYLFSIENTTGKYIDFDFDEITINDYTVSDLDYDLFDKMILNNCQIVCTVSVDSQFMQDNDIDSVETIEWNMAIRPNSDYFNESKVGPIVYKVQE